MKKTCLYPKNVKTTEPIEAYIFEATHMTPEKNFLEKMSDFFMFENVNRKIRENLRTI